MAVTIKRLLLALAWVVVLAGPGGAGSQSDNIRLVANFPMELGNEIEFDGDRIYVNQYGTGDVGIHLFELNGKRLTERGVAKCPGHTDAAALDRKMVAVSLQGGLESCAGGSGGVGGGVPLMNTVGGVQVIDFADPKRPRYLGAVSLPGGTHTLTRHPGGPYVYASLGGADAYAAHGGREHIIDVSDPNAPTVAAEYMSPLNPAGCHDVAFARIKDLIVGFCPGQGGTEIWDASDPVAPEPIARIVLPLGQLPHTVAVSSDGEVAAISDEAYAFHACRGGSPVGALWFYDIADLEQPQLLGFYGPQRGTLPVGSLSGNNLSCTAHNFNFIPDSRLIVAAWITGGTNVIDISDPLRPTEIAHYQPDGTIAMSSYWYRGRIYVGDFERGLDVLGLRRP